LFRNSVNKRIAQPQAVVLPGVSAFFEHGESASVVGIMPTLCRVFLSGPIFLGLV